MPLVVATDESVEGYGVLVERPEDIDIEIVRWPATGWRPVDEDSGDEAGWVEGIFLGTGKATSYTAAMKPYQVITCWAGQHQTRLWLAVIRRPATDPRLFCGTLTIIPMADSYSFLDKGAFVVPVALPGDDLHPEQVIALWCDGSRGLYIHPGVWHEGIFPVTDSQSFLDRQGRVHARVSCDLAEEFGVYLSVPLTKNPN